MLTPSLLLGGCSLLVCAAGILSTQCTALVSTSGLADHGQADGGLVPEEAGIDAEAGGACQADLLTSASHCGACGVVCAPQTGAVCKEGKCTLPRACSELFAQSPRPPRGVYRLGPPAGGAFDAYCELDPAADGGGWTLLLKTDGASDHFAYANIRWTNADTLNPDRPDLDATEAKLAGFATMPFTQLRVGMLDAGKARWVVAPIAAPSLRELFSGAHVPTTLGRAAWRSLLASPSTQANCNREGVNVFNDTDVPRVRIGIIFNNEDDCVTIDSFVGLGSSFTSTVTGNLAASSGFDDGPRQTKAIGYLMIR